MIEMLGTMIVSIVALYKLVYCGGVWGSDIGDCEEYWTGECDDV